MYSSNPGDTCDDGSRDLAFVLCAHALLCPGTRRAAASVASWKAQVHQATFSLALFHITCPMTCLPANTFKGHQSFLLYQVALPSGKCASCNNSLRLFQSNVQSPSVNGMASGNNICQMLCQDMSGHTARKVPQETKIQRCTQTTIRKGKEDTRSLFKISLA